MRLTFVSENNRNDTKVLVGLGRRNKTMSIFCLFKFLERQDCSVNATAFALSNLVSLRLCPDFLIGDTNC